MWPNLCEYFLPSERYFAKFKETRLSLKKLKTMDASRDYYICQVPQIS